MIFLTPFAGQKASPNPMMSLFKEDIIDKNDFPL
jgi:hypothetical protein